MWYFISIFPICQSNWGLIDLNSLYKFTWKIMGRISIDVWLNWSLSYPFWIRNNICIHFLFLFCLCISIDKYTDYNHTSFVYLWTPNFQQLWSHVLDSFFEGSQLIYFFILANGVRDKICTEKIAPTVPTSKMLQLTLMHSLNILSKVQIMTQWVHHTKSN